MNKPWAFLAILSLNVLAFIAQALFPGITNLGALGHDQPIWTNITHMFLHENFGHIFYNMIFTAPFAVHYESIVGSRKFFTHWLICGVGAAQFFLLMPTLVPVGLLIGASGACSGIMALSLISFKRNVLYEAYAVVGILGLFFSNFIPGLMDCFIPSGVAHMAHVGGMLTGLLIACINLKSTPTKR